MRQVLDRSTPVNLQHLINRINLYSQFAEEDSERKEHWEAKIEESKALIVKAVLEHDQNPALEQIFLRDTQFCKRRVVADGGVYFYWVRTDWLYRQNRKLKDDPEALFEAAQKDPESGFSISEFKEGKENG